MNIFLRTFNRFKKDGMYIVLIDIATMILLIGLITLLRSYLGSLVLSIEGLDSIGSNIDQEKLAELLADVQPVADKFNLVFYFLFPVAFFLIAYYLQALSFGIAIERSKKVFDYRYIGRFMLFSLPGFIAFIVVVNLLFGLLSLYFLPELAVGGYEDFVLIARTLAWIMVLMFAIGYFTLIAYGMLLKTDMKKTLKETFRIGIRKSYVFLPFVIIFALSRILIGNSILGFILSVYSQDIGYGYIVSFLILTSIIAYMKIFNVELIRKYQQDS